MGRARTFLFLTVLAAAIVIPLSFAATSPLLAWRQPVYIIGGFAGVIALAVLLLQPLLAIGIMPGLSLQRSRTIHRGIGMALVVAVVAHVFALWITSPPDVIDALLFRSPTWFSVWGVIAMWAVFASFALIAIRGSTRINPRALLAGHRFLAIIIVAGTTLHAILIEDTMEMVSKSVLCALVLIATCYAVASRRLKKWRTNN